MVGTQLAAAILLTGMGADDAEEAGRTTLSGTALSRPGW